MLYVTHDQVEAMTMADRIVVMNGGVIEQAGTPFEVYDSPANTYVAGFIGSPAMNFLDGVLEEGAGGAGVRLGPDQWLPVASSGRAEPGRPVRCGLRPEHLTVAEDGLRGRVVTVEPTGSETSVVVDTGVGRLTCHLRERRALHPGEPLALRCAPAQVHLFDQQSGVHL
jgi:multiple sugar transport system ATP-binding protein